MNKKIYLWFIVFLSLEGLFPIFTYFALENISTLWLVAFSVTISFFFGLIILFKEKLYKQFKKKELYFPVFMASLFMWIWWILYFFWIKYSSPSIAAIFLLLQSLFAFIAFNLIWKENYNYKQIIWAILMFLWWVIILYNGESFINLWALIMIIACISWTIWNFFTKKASLKWANPFFILINRNFLMAIIISILAYIFIWEPDIDLIKQNFIWIFLIWFLIFFLSKVIWISILSKVNWFIAISTFPLIPLFVMIFSYFILWQIPTTQQIIWFIPIFIGSYMLIK